MTTKHDEGKWRFTLVPTVALKQIIMVLEFGAKKYTPGGWKTVPNARERYFNACIRHLAAWWDGEQNDSESGLNHLAHAGCCIFFLLWLDGDEK